MIAISAWVVYATAQLVIAALLAALLHYLLGDVARGALAWRRRWAVLSFYAAIFAPFLAVKLPASLAVTTGPQSTQLFAAGLPTFDLQDTPALQTLATSAVFVWIAVAILRLLRTLQAVQAGEQRAREAVRNTADPRVAEADVAGPMVVGLMRPVVLLPRNMPELERAFVLRHEFEHMRRGDLFAALAQRVAEDLFWWNPCLRFLGRVCAEQRELCCDEAAAGEGGRTAYSRLLLNYGSAKGTAAFGIHAAAGGLSRRIERVISPTKPKTRFALLLLLLIMAAAIIAAPRSTDAGSTNIGIASS